jgi:hypothetical protein
MKIWHRASVAVALAGAMAVSVVAQPPGGGFGGMMQGGRGGMDPAAMLMNKSVQEELKISDEEAKEIIQKYSEESATLLVKVLESKGKNDQARRLNQIRVQQMGLRAFADEKIASTLKLTSDQKNEIKEIGEDLRKEVEGMRKDIGMDFTKMREMMRKVTVLQKDAVTKAGESFSADQKKAWSELVGSPFEIKMDMGGGRPGGRRPPTDN